MTYLTFFCLLVYLRTLTLEMSLFLTKQFNLSSAKIIDEFDEYHKILIECRSIVSSKQSDNCIQTHYYVELEKNDTNSNNNQENESILMRFMLISNKELTVLYESRFISINEMKKGFRLDWNVMYDSDLSIGYQKILENQNDMVQYEPNVEFKYICIILGNFKLNLHFKRSSILGYMTCIMKLENVNNNKNDSFKNNILEICLECNNVQQQMCNVIDKYLKQKQVNNNNTLFTDMKCNINISINVIQHHVTLPPPSFESPSFEMKVDDSIMLRFIDQEIESKGIQSIYGNQNDKFNVNFQEMNDYFANKQAKKQINDQEELSPQQQGLHLLDIE